MAPSTGTIRLVTAGDSDVSAIVVGAVEVTPEAQAQLERLDRWWRQNRPAAPTLVVAEFERLIGRIAETPESGVPYAPGGLMNVRRL